MAEKRKFSIVEMKRQRAEAEQELRDLQEADVLRLEEFAATFPEVENIERGEIHRLAPTKETFERIQKAFDRITYGVFGQLDADYSCWGRTDVEARNLHELWHRERVPTVPWGGDDTPEQHQAAFEAAMFNLESAFNLLKSVRRIAQIREEKLK